MPPSDDTEIPGRVIGSEVGRRLVVGIGITTFNRATMLRRTIEAVRTHTRHPHILFVADDGSSDGTVEMLGEMQVTHLAASNRGIAWNKNRALFYLNQVRRCDVIILLEDDTYPNADGWEAVWIDAATRYGHVNLYPSHWTESNVSGSGTAEDPFVSKVLTGQCSAFTRRSIDTSGFLDSRFRRYGYEHAEHTQRMISCGYGGLVDAETGAFLPYLITSALTVSGLDKGPDMDGVVHNAPIFEQLKTEPKHRWAWRTDEEMAIFRCEQAAVVDAAPNHVSRQDQGPDWLVASFDGRRLLMDSASPAMRAAAPSERGVAIFARVRGKTAHLGVLDLDQISWLRVDLPDGFHSVPDQDDATLFDFVSAPDAGFGLRHQDHFLCCDMGRDGKVAFSRTCLSEWETFHFNGYASASQTSP